MRNHPSRELCVFVKNCFFERIHGVSAGPGGIFFEIRPFEKARSLVLPAPMGLSKAGSPGPGFFPDRMDMEGGEKVRK